MGTISSAFNLISSALDADQSALSISANNVANANTPGYTEETPNWVENSPVEINGVAYGAGVTQTGPVSTRDRVLEERLDQQQQLTAASTSRLTALNTMQALFTPDSGTSTGSAGDIGSDITSFFDFYLQRHISCHHHLQRRRRRKLSADAQRPDYPAQRSRQPDFRGRRHQQRLRGAQQPGRRLRQRVEHRRGRQRHRGAQHRTQLRLQPARHRR
ncbi:MAG: flagellar basal body protein [Terracidiphilus sp.]